MIKPDDEVWEAGGEIPSDGVPIDPDAAVPAANRQRAIAVLRAALADVERGDLAPEAVEQRIARRLDLLRAGQGSDIFADRWKVLADWGDSWLSTAPPKRRWLLERDNPETRGQTTKGVLPLGKTGLLIAAGGVGKTMALVQLALSVATGRKWLDTFHTPASSGRILLALAEEDAEEIHRRVFNAACAMRLTDEQKRRASELIVAVPLAGTSVALTQSDGANTVESPILDALRKRLDDGGEWTLIVLDPLSRFAGCDAEKDNAAATRFVEAAESLTKVRGEPTVLIAHHTNKVSRSGESEASASDARGASALTDGVRWAGSLTRIGDDAASFAVTKSNYAPWGSPVILVREADYGGALRAETTAEREGREEREKKQTEAKNQRRGNGGKPAVNGIKSTDYTGLPSYEPTDDEY